MTNASSDNLGPLWPQDTPILSDREVSIYHGIIKLLKARKQISVLHLIVAGTYSELLTNSPRSTGIEIMEKAASIYVSFARLQQELLALATVADSAGKIVPANLRKMQETTSEFGEKL